MSKWQAWKNPSEYELSVDNVIACSNLFAFLRMLGLKACARNWAYGANIRPLNTRRNQLKEFK